MKSSVDPRVEIDNILARLKLLGLTEMGFPQGYEFPLDGFGKKQPYRDFEPGSVIPKAGGRLLAAGEQGQPHIWAFQVHHYASSRQDVIDLSIETDLSLIDWAPSAESSPITTFFFNMYDEFAKNGESVGWIATRFYQTVLGQDPLL